MSGRKPSREREPKPFPRYDDAANIDSAAVAPLPPWAQDAPPRGDPAATYHLGFVGEKDNYFGHAKKKKGNFVERMERLGSCKGFFVGHDHLNTLSITYRGMRMTYGMSIDYLAYVSWLGQIPTAKCRTQRGGTVIDINADGTFEVSLLPLTDIEAAENAAKD